MSKQIRQLKVLGVKDYEYGYVIQGVDTIKTDTLYFISLKDSIDSYCNFQKVEIGKSYLFEIEDLDNVNGHLPAAMPNGYYIKLGTKRIKRDGRNGHTITTTQYFSKNTKGLWIEK